ncbi:MAG: hypothetical protein JKY26_17595 [Pseudomonas sp.]|nr:hypothetical protein [Pseudomonas sp.]
MNLSDMSSAQVAIVLLGVLVIALIAIATFSVRQAYREGKRDGRNGNDFLILELRQQLAKKISESEIARHQAADAMEQQWIRFESELKPLQEENARNAEAYPLMNQLKRDNAEQEQRIESLKQALTKFPPLPAQITIRDTETIQHMAEKLRLASSAFHATQQFKVAREADRLGFAGEMLADRLRTAMQADAAPTSSEERAA